MSVIPVEKAFPRGGLKEFTTHSRPSFQSPSLFRVKKPRHIPRNNFNGDSPNTSKDHNSTHQKGDNVFRMKKFTGQLTYKSVSEGMLSIGAIFAITELELKVSLPGNTVATIPITNISETYTTALRNAIVSHSNERIAPLREMFKIGQHVIARVVGKELQNNRHKITLSLDPQVLYPNINPEDLRKGSIVIASVKSIEDKGYVMAIGNSSVRAFLSHERAAEYELDWNDGKKLGLGQIVRCYVKKATTLDLTTTLVLSAKSSKVAEANYDKTGSTLESLMPGMKFTASVSHLFPNGIQIQLSDNFVGYVHRDHFEAPFKRPENYEIGTSVKAQVLYILPSGVVYFTLKAGILEATPPTDPYTIIKCGEIITDATVFGASDMGLIVKVGNHEGSALKGFVPLNQTSYKSRLDNDAFDMPISQQLQMEFPIQSDVTCRIMDFNYMELYYVCTMDQELMNEKIINPVLLEVGMVLQCTVKSIQLKGIVLSIGKGCHATGFVPLTYISDVLLSNPEKKYHVGQTCTARVLSLKDGKIMFTMKRLQVQSKDPILTSFEDAAVGDAYVGSVQQINEHGLLIQFFNFVSGWLPTKYLGADTVRTNITSKYDLGQLVPCKIVDKDETQKKLELALRDFEIPTTNGIKKQEKKKKRKETTEDDDTKQHLSEWEISESKAKPVKYLVPEVPVVLSKRAARKLKAEANRERREREKEASSDGTSVLSESSARKRKTSDTQSETEPPKKKVDSQTNNVSKKEEATDETAGLSKRAARKLKKKTSQLKALVEQLEKEKKELKELTTEFSKIERSEQHEDNVETHTPDLPEKAAKKQKVLRVEQEEKVNESLKKAKKSIQKVNEVLAPTLSKKAAKKLNASASGTEHKGKEPRENDPIISEKAIKKRKNDESQAEPEEKKPKTAKESTKEQQVELKLPSLAVSNGFVWDATPNLLPVVAGIQEEPESSDEEEQTTTQVKKTRQVIQHEKRIQAQQEEARLRKIEQRLMDEDAPPQSADEFDRLVLSSPDSSIVWLQYMTFHLQATEIEKAKNIGLRALNTISFREEQERLNVWGALLNLENLYGTKESLETTLEEAIKNNDAYEVHNRMLAIYGESGKFEEGDKLIAAMAKKFRHNKDMWYTAAVFYMKSSQMEKARALLARALSVLTKKEHVGTITRFAHLENKLGSKERAQTLMEQVLTSYPKRVDVWGQYVDMLVKSGLIPMARQVLERAVCQSLPSHKMKTMFKKFLAFEEAHGTEDDAQKVRLLALKYVESATNDV